MNFTKDLFVEALLKRDSKFLTTLFSYEKFGYIIPESYDDDQWMKYTVANLLLKHYLPAESDDGDDFWLSQLRDHAIFLLNLLPTKLDKAVFKCDFYLATHLAGNIHAQVLCDNLFAQVSPICTARDFEYKCTNTTENNIIMEMVGHYLQANNIEKALELVSHENFWYRSITKKDEWFYDTPMAIYLSNKDFSKENGYLAVRKLYDSFANTPQSAHNKLMLKFDFFASLALIHAIHIEYWSFDSSLIVKCAEIF